jgi:phage gp16-like protein
MAQTALKPGSADARQRKALYAKIAAARKALGIGEEAYRDLLAQLFQGVRSAKDLSVPDLDSLVGYFKAQGWTPAPPKTKPPARAGTRALADAPEAKKARALWISLYHLGVVRSPAESALAAFGRRQTGKAALQWIRGDLHKVIEALKDMAAREAGVDWSVHPMDKRLARGVPDRLRVVWAQWEALVAAGAAERAGMDGYCSRIVGHHPHGQTIVNMTAAELDRVIEALGPKVRAAKAAASANSPES